MILSAAQLAILRQQPQGTKLWLSVYRPATLLAAQVNNPVITRGAREIAFDSVTSGSYLLIEADVTCMIGTSPGQDDIGRIRVRSITSSVITVAENTISWADNHYLTVIQQVDINAVFPRITNVGETVTFFKDYDLAYTNQNTVLGSFPNMGSHRAAFREGGNASIYYTSTGTYNVNGDSLTYLWEFEGGNPTGSTLATPGYVSYSTTGHKRTKLTVTNVSGGQDISYRYISIYDRPENGTAVPILNWQLNQFAGSVSEGGYNLGLTVRESIEAIQPNAIVVIFADDFYGSTDVSLGGNQQNNEKIVFVGYVLGDTISYDYQNSSVDFQVGSVTEVMKIAEGFSCSVNTKSSASTWFEITDMSVAKAVYHYLRWHSTVLKVTDFQYTGDDRKVQHFDADRQSLYDAISSFISSGVLGRLISDRQGKLWAEILPEGRSNPLSLPVAMTLSNQDWIGSPSLTERRTELVSFLEMGGIAYSGINTGTFSALLSNAPDTAPLYRGKVEKIEGLILNDQSHLNTMAGNYVATKNSRFPEIRMNLAGNYRNLDIAPIEIVKPSILQGDTIRGVNIINDSYRPESMTWSYNATNGLLTPEITLQRIGTGSAGTTIVIPDVPEDGGFTQGGFRLPRVPALGLPAQFAALANSLSTGSSCCDYFANLGLGAGVYETLLVRVSPTPDVSSSPVLFGFEYSSNPNMYDAVNQRAPLLNTSTVTYYWEITGDWEVTEDVSGTTRECNLIIELNTGNDMLVITVHQSGYGGSLGDGEYKASGGVGSVGSFSLTGETFNVNFAHPNYLQALVGTNQVGTPTFKVRFRNIRFHIST